jgi:predicted nucleotidyltransferase
MKTLEELNLKDNEKKALLELKEKILERFPDAEIILYGSKARGDADEESDIDLLILVKNKVDTKLEEEIIGLVYDLELKWEVVFGLLIESKDFWSAPLAKAMPIHWNIDKEGLLI